MKNTTKSGIIVLVVLILVVAGYTAYTIKNQNLTFEKSVSTSSDIYRVAENSDAYDPLAAKN